jgi:hypothetical protein
MIRNALAVSLGLSLLWATGCVKMSDEYTINPDGSGKVKISRLQPAEMNMFGGKKELDPEEETKKSARKILEKSTGVDAWKDVSWKVADDGRILITGTAYFKDVTKVRFGGEGANIRLEKGEGGKLVLRMGKAKKGPAAAPEGDAPEKLSEEELKKKVLVQKMKWQQGRGMFVAMMSGLEMKTVINLPGKIEKLSCFKKEGDRKVQFTLKGDDFLKVIDEYTAKEDFWKKQATEPGRGDLKNMDTPEALEKLFGSKEPPVVELSGATAPLFNYAEEVAAARKLEPAIRAKLAAKPKTPASTTKPPEVAPPAAGAGMVETWVTDVRQKLKVDLPKGKGIFASSPGLEIKILGQLPGAVLDLKNGDLEKAVADNGADLMSKSSFNRKTQSAYTQGTAKDFVSFGVKLEPLPEGAKAVKELSGHLLYSVGTGAKTTDIGEIELKRGSTGTALGAKVTNYSKFFGVTLELDLKSPSMVKGFEVTDADGKAIEASVGRRSTWSGKSRVTMRLPKDCPAKLKVKVVLFEKTEQRKLPFKLENIQVR